MPNVQTQPLLDQEYFGRLVRAARIAANYPTTTEGAEALARFGYPLSDRALAAMERGEVKPNLTFWAACLIVFAPGGGDRYFLPAFREDIRTRLESSR
jgi:hypothetical protein